MVQLVCVQPSAAIATIVTVAPGVYKPGEQPGEALGMSLTVPFPSDPAANTDI